MKDGQLLLSSRANAVTGLAVALLAGFVASVAMVVAFGIGYLAAFVLGRLSLPVLSSWFLGLTSNQLIDIAGPHLYAATAMFVVGGLLWALLYVFVFEPRLSGAPWERGVKFAVVPWLFSLIVFMPLVGGGLLGSSLGAGPLPVFGNFILHLVYGALLGAVYGSADLVVDRPHVPDAEDLLAGRVSEVGAAEGMLVGLALGSGLGVVGALLPQLSGANGLSVNPLATVVAIGLAGAAFGGFVGSFSSAD